MKKVILISLITLSVIGVFVYFIIIPKYFYGIEASTKKFVKFSTNDKSIIPDDIFVFDYYLKAMDFNIPIIENCDYSINELSANKWLVEINAEATNGFGAKIKKKFGLIFIKEYGNYRVSDSYDYLTFNDNRIIFNGDESDLEKIKAIKDLKSNLEILDWSFKSTYNDGVGGKGIIKNNSKYPVRFIEANVNYSYKNKETDSDKFFLIGGDELKAGQIKSFEWYTTPCNRCGTANLSIANK